MHVSILSANLIAISKVWEKRRDGRELQRIS
jgi:hypothetical protein